MSVKVVIGGDFFPGNTPGNEAPSSPESAWGDALELLRAADFSIVNLEAPVTLRGRPILKDGPNLRLPPAALDLLRAGGVDVATMANNHILDYGPEGLLDTLQACREAGIATVGAGADAAEAGRTLYLESGSLRLAVVNFAENEWASAREGRAGANPMDPVDNCGQIRQAADVADHVLVIVHGGHEHFHYPSPRIRKLYRWYAEQGATVVVSHHTHCYGGWEVHAGVPIFYGVGNLLFPGRGRRPRWHRGILLELDLQDGGRVVPGLHPFTQCADGKLGISLARGDEREQALREIEAISDVVRDDARLREVWDAFVDAQGYRLATVTVRSRLLQILLYRLGKRPGWLLGRSRLMRMLSLFRCEAHRDVMLESLRRYLEDGAD